MILFDEPQGKFKHFILRTTFLHWQPAFFAVVTLEHKWLSWTSNLSNVWEFHVHSNCILSFSDPLELYYFLLLLQEISSFFLSHKNEFPSNDTSNNYKNTLRLNSKFLDILHSSESSCRNEKCVQIGNRFWKWIAGNCYVTQWEIVKECWFLEVF